MFIYKFKYKLKNYERKILLYQPFNLYFQIIKTNIVKNNLAVYLFIYSNFSCKFNDINIR